jgi:putative flippase GtrA
MQIIKYILTGLINTIVGYSVFWVLLKHFNFSAEYANAAGYGSALIVAFVLNKIFVFNQSTFSRSMIPRFILAFTASFLINQIVLIIIYRVIGLQVEIAQAIAMGTYTVMFYFLNKRFVFNEKLIQEKY